MSLGSLRGQWDYNDNDDKREGNRNINDNSSCIDNVKMTEIKWNLGNSSDLNECLFNYALCKLPMICKTELLSYMYASLEYLAVTNINITPPYALKE